MSASQSIPQCRNRCTDATVFACTTSAETAVRFHPFCTREHRRSDNNPVKSTLHDQAFIQLVVCPNIPQDQCSDDVSTKRIQFSSRLRNHVRRQVDQAANAGLLHRIDDVVHSHCELAVAAEQGGSTKRAEHGIVAGNHALNRVAIGDVSLGDREVGMTDRESEGLRTNAVTVRPCRSPWFTSSRPVPSDAPKISTFIGRPPPSDSIHDVTGGASSNCHNSQKNNRAFAVIGVMRNHSTR